MPQSHLALANTETSCADTSYQPSEAEYHPIQSQIGHFLQLCRFRFLPPLKKKVTLWPSENIPVWHRSKNTIQTFFSFDRNKFFPHNKVVRHHLRMGLSPVAEFGFL